MTMLREDDGRSQGDRRTKGELCREDVHDILQGIQDLALVELTAERVARHTPAGNAHKVSGGLASVGDLAKSKTKEKGKAEHREVHLTLLFGVFDKVGANRRNGTVKRPAVQAGPKNPNIIINGDIKTRQRVRPEMFLNISQYISELMTSGTDELNRGKNKEKKSKIVCVTT